MSNTVDDRIVSMQFDNAQFEKAVGQTITTLGNLDKALQLENGAKGFENLNKAVGVVSFSKIQNGIESLQDSFSLWGVVARRAVENVVDTVEGKLLSAIKKIALDPINDGFKEYELKMGSIQTIMASTGEDLATVKGYLEELNTYSDKTIYKFSDMTNNIGKFTNAGVKLDDAVAAIKGISNEAAISGANTNEASRAMYNFSQALSSGYVKLIDWKSIENANMATVGFKDALLETAEALGNVQKNADGTYKVLTKNSNGKTMKESISATKNFNDSLAHQWMTTDVLTETLKHYATDVRELTKAEKAEYEASLKKKGFNEIQIKNIESMGIKAADAATEVKTYTMMVDALMEAIGSGWATTFELIIGDFNEAKAMWTSVNNVLSGIVDKVSDARNQFLKGFLGNNVFKFHWNRVKKLGLVTDEFKNKVTDMAKKAGWDVDGLIKKYGSFEDSLQAGWLSAEYFDKAVEETNGKLKKGTHELTEYGKAIEYQVISNLKDGDKRFKRLLDSGYDYHTLIALIKAQVRGYNIAQGDLTDEQIRSITTVEAEQEALRNLSKTVEKADLSLLDVSETLSEFTGSIMDVYLSGREILLLGLGNIFTSLGQIIRSVGRAFKNTFEVISPERILDWLHHGFEETTEQMILTNKQCRIIRKTVQKLLRPLKELADIAKDAVTALMPFATDLFVTGFKLMTGSLWILGDISKYVAQGIQKLRDAASKNVIVPLGVAVQKHVLPYWEQLKTVVSELPKRYRKLKKKAIEFGDWNKVAEDVNTAWGAFKRMFETIYALNGSQFGLVSWGKVVVGEFTKLKNAIIAAFTDNTQIDEFINGQLAKLEEVVSNWTITKIITNARLAFEKFFKTLSQIQLTNLPQMFSQVSRAFGNLGTQLLNIFNYFTGADQFIAGLQEKLQAFYNGSILSELSKDFGLFGTQMSSMFDYISKTGNLDFGFIFGYAAEKLKTLRTNVWATISDFTILDETVAELQAWFNETSVGKFVNGLKESIKNSEKFKMAGQALKKSWTQITTAFQKFKETAKKAFALFDLSGSDYKNGFFDRWPKAFKMLKTGFKTFGASVKNAVKNLHLFEAGFGGITLGVDKAFKFVLGPNNPVSSFIDGMRNTDFKGLMGRLKETAHDTWAALNGEGYIDVNNPNAGGIVNFLWKMVPKASAIADGLGEVRAAIEEFTGIKVPDIASKISSVTDAVSDLLVHTDWEKFHKNFDPKLDRTIQSFKFQWQDAVDHGFWIKDGRFVEQFLNIGRLTAGTRQLGRDLVESLDSATHFLDGSPLLSLLGYDKASDNHGKIPVFGRMFVKLRDSLGPVGKAARRLSHIFTNLERGIKATFGVGVKRIEKFLKPVINLRAIVFSVSKAWERFNHITEYGLKRFLNWHPDMSFGDRMEWLKKQYGDFFKSVIDSIKNFSKIDELFAALKKKFTDLGLAIRNFLLGNNATGQVSILAGLFGLLAKAVQTLWKALANSVIGKFLKPFFMMDFVMRDIITAVRRFAASYTSVMNAFKMAGIELTIKSRFKIIASLLGKMLKDIGRAMIENFPGGELVEFVKGKFQELAAWLDQFQWFRNLKNFAQTNQVMIILGKVIQAIAKAMKELITSSTEAGGFFHLLYMAVSSLVKVILDRVIKAIDRFKDNLSVLKDKADELSKGSGIQILLNVLNFLADALLMLAGIDLSGFNRTNLKVIDGLKKLGGGVKNTLSSLFSFKGLTDRLGPGFKRWFKSTTMIARAQLPLGEKIKGVFNVTTNLFGTLLNGLVINEKLRKVLNVIGGVIRALGGAFISVVAIHIPNLISNITNAIGPFLEKLKLKDRLKAFGEGFMTLLDKIQNGGAIDWIVEKLKKFGDAIKNFVDLDAFSFSGIGGEKTMFGAISDFVDKFKGFGMNEQQLDAFNKFIESLGGTGSALDQMLEKFGIKPDKLSGLFGLLKAIAKLKMLFAGADLVSSIAGLFGVGKHMSKMFDSFGSAAKAYERNLKADTFHTIASGILMIAGAMAILALINPTRLFQSALALAGVLMVVAVVVQKMSELQKASADAGLAVGGPFATFVDGVKSALASFAKGAGLGLLALGLAGSLVLLAKAIYMFTDILVNKTQYKEGMIAVGIIAVAFMAFAGMMTAFGDKLSGIGTAFLGLAAAVWIMQSAIKRMKDLDENAVWAAIGVAFAMSVLIGILMVITAVASAFGAKTALQDVGSAFLGLAGAVWILSLAVKRIGKMEKGKKAGILGVIALIASIAMAIYFLGKLPVDEEGGSAVANAAKAITDVANAMKSMVIAAAIIGMLPWEKVARGIAFMIAPLVAIFAMLKLMDKFVKNAESNADAVVTIAGALAVMAAAMTVLGFLPVDVFARGLVAILALSGALALVLAAANGIDSGEVTKTILALGAAFVVLAGAMFLLGKFMSWDEIGRGIVAIIAPLAALVATLWLLSLIGPGITLVGSAVLAFGAGLLMTVGAIALFSLALPLIINAIKLLIDNIGPLLGSLLSAIGTFISNGLAYLRENGPAIAAQIGGMLLSLLDTIGAILTGLPWGTILKAVWDHAILPAIKWIGEQLANLGDWLGLNINRAVWGAERWLREAIADIVKTLVDILIDSFGEMPLIGDWVKSQGEDIKNGMDKWVDEAGETLDELNKTYEEKYGKVGKTVEEVKDSTKASVDEMRDAVNQKVSMTGFNGMPSEANAALRKMKSTIQEETPEIVESTQTLVNGVNGAASGIDVSGFTNLINGDMLNGMLNTEAFAGVGSDNIMAFLGGLKDGMNADQITSLASSLGINLDQGAIDGITSKLPELQSLAEQLGIDTVDFAALGSGVSSPSWKFEEIGMYCVEGLKNGFTNGLSGFTGFMTGFGDSLVGTFSLMPTAMSKKMASNMTAMAKAIRGKSSAVRSAANKVATEAVSAVNKWQNFYNMGQHCVNGMISGIRSKISDARRAAEDLGNAVTAGTRSTTKVASPSRVFMEIGRFVVAGLAIGIAKNAYQAAAAAEDMGDSTIDAVANALSTLGRMAEEDINYTPTITPVVDLSSARLGFSSLNSMGSDLQLSLDGAINSKWDELNAMYDRLNGMTVGTDNSDVVSAINSLKADNAALRESIANMKVMLNRRIVGQIDNGLGQQQLLANRGV